MTDKERYAQYMLFRFTNRDSDENDLNEVRLYLENPHNLKLFVEMFLEFVNRTNIYSEAAKDELEYFKKPIREIAAAVERIIGNDFSYKEFPNGVKDLENIIKGRRSLIEDSSYPHSFIYRQFSKISATETKVQQFRITIDLVKGAI